MKFLRNAVRFAASRSLATVLLTALAACVVIGAFFSQLILAGALRAPAGILREVLRFLSFEDLFAARWLQALMLALLLNLLLCSFRRIRLRLLRPDQLAGLLHFRQIATAVPIDDSFDLIREELRTPGYRVRVERRTGCARLAARRNGLSLAGSILFHLSLIIGFLGFLVRGRQGFEGDVALFPETGAAVPLPRGDTLYVQLTGTAEEHNLGPGIGRTFLRRRSADLVLYRNDRYLRTARLSINRPARVDGLGLYLSDPVQVFVLRITPPDTVVRVRERDPLIFAEPTGLYACGLTRLGKVFQGDSVFSRFEPAVPLVKRAAPGRDSVVDTLRLGRIAELGGRSISLLNVRPGARIAYRYDPGANWFYLAAALFLLGILLRGLLPAYEVHAAATEEEGETVIRLGGRALGLFTSLRPLFGRITDRLTDAGTASRSEF
jgi:cytochrome c biogenesis protein ResB